MRRRAAYRRFAIEQGQWLNPFAHQVGDALQDFIPFAGTHGFPHATAEAGVGALHRAVYIGASGLGDFGKDSPVAGL